MSNLIKEDLRLVTVCDSCLQASCWQGIFYCDNWQRSGTIEVMVKELKKLNRENKSYWKEGVYTNE